jgi:hypothetical protein
MPTNGLIVTAPVKPGFEEHLRLTLNRIGNDIRGKRLDPDVPEPHIDFPRSSTIHFARIALFDDPNKQSGRKRLLLVTDYHGPWEEHVAELIAITTEPYSIWGCCEGYTDEENFPDFIRAHMVEPQAYYIALPEYTLKRIRELIQLRLQFDTRLFDLLPGGSLVNKFMRFGSELARFPLAGVDVLSILLEHGPLNTLLAARRVNATLDRVWWIWLFNRLTLNAHPQPKHRYSAVPVDDTLPPTPTDSVDEPVSPDAWDGTPSEDLVSQNQLTLVTVVRPEQVRRLQAVLAIIDLFGRRLAPPGSLVGISTIHTVRWALLDDQQRLLLASNYDGTWENYIDEFAELILSGLDAIWESSYSYPEAGAQDVEALKYFLRSHQAPANVFYSAYPDTTLLNLVDALEIERQTATQTEPTEAGSPAPRPVSAPFTP